MSLVVLETLYSQLASVVWVIEFLAPLFATCSLAICDMQKESLPTLLLAILQKATGPDQAGHASEMTDSKKFLDVAVAICKQVI